MDVAADVGNAEVDGQRAEQCAQTEDQQAKAHQQRINLPQEDDHRKVGGKRKVEGEVNEEERAKKVVTGKEQSEEMQVLL